MTATPHEPIREQTASTLSDAELHEAVDGAPVLFWVADEAGRYRYVNRYWLEFTGRSHLETIGDRWIDAVHPTDRQRRVAALEEAIEAVRPFELTYRLGRHDGSFRWVLDRGAPILDDKDRLVGFSGSCIDVTEQRMALSSLARQTQLAGLVFEAARIGAWSWTPASNEVQWSPELEALFGLAPGCFEGTLAAFMERIDPAHRSSVAEQLEGSVARSQPFTFEYQVPLPDGTTRWLEARGCPLVEPTGEVNEWIGVAIDVSERHEAEIERESLLRSTLQSKARAEQANDALRRAVKRLDAVLLHKEEVAETLQQAVLPLEMPDIEGVAICASYLPGATADSAVGGDWYDVSFNDEGRPAFVIGDVAGHGIGAAVSMARLRYASQLCVQEGATPAEVLGRINRFIEGGEHWEMATACAVTLDLGTRSLTVSRAGHPPPLLWRPSGVAEYLDAVNGPPLGVQAGTPFDEVSYDLEPGCLLLLYTDGLIERRGESLDVGFRRLRTAVLAQAATTPLSDICEDILGSLFVDAERHDDVAILAVRVD